MKNTLVPMLRVSGGKLVKEDGTPILLRGVNCAGLEWDSRNDKVLPAVIRAMDEWNANIVRLPVSQNRWFGCEKEQQGEADADSYRAIVDSVIEAAAVRGGYVILDLHWSDRGDWHNTSGQQLMPDDHSVLFWEDAAKRYADCSNVLFGLYNEPHDVSWNIWLSGGMLTHTDGVKWHAVGMEALLKAVRGTGADNVCVIGGLDWGYTFEGFSAYDALSEASAGNLLLDSHVYPWKRLDWDRDVGDDAIFPVLIGECGHYGDDADPREGKQCLPSGEWVPRLLSWIEEHGYHLTAWDFHPGAGPCLIKNFDGEPTPYYGAYVKEFLKK